MFRVRNLLLLFTSLVAACGANDARLLRSVDDSNGESAPLTSGGMPMLPWSGGTGVLTPWGGSDPSRWRPEAILANATSEALNNAWSLPNVRDAVVAVPVRLLSSAFSEFGDGQDNAAPSFEGWSGSRPPVVATLVSFSDGTPSKVLFRFDRTLPSGGNAFEVSYKINGTSTRVPLTATQSAAGDWTAEWVVPTEVGFNSLLSNQVVVVHPAGWGDWFPIWFRIPVRPIADFEATVPASMRAFADGRDIVDHEQVSAKANPNSAQSPFDRLRGHTFPSYYNQNPYNPQDIHARFPSNGQVYVTGVGQGWTWVAWSNAPFKIMYTCFDGRTPSAEASAPNGGVPSGGGWHLIGDPAETILNDLEAGPLVVGSGMNNPYPRTMLDSGGFAYNLSDVAVVRWLRPGEAFITRRGNGTTDANGNWLPQPNYHWYFFQQARPVCTEEWVHPTVPTDSYDFSPPTTPVSFEADGAYTTWGENVVVVGDVPELGGWSPANGVRLSATNYPNWTGQVSLPQGTQVNFKFVKVDNAGNPTWEAGANRQLTVPTSSPGQYVGTWQ